MSDIVKARYEAFGCAGQASKIKVIGLEVMAGRYSVGELEPGYLRVEKISSSPVLPFRTTRDILDANDFDNFLRATSE